MPRSWREATLRSAGEDLIRGFPRRDALRGRPGWSRLKEAYAVFQGKILRLRMMQEPQIVDLLHHWVIRKLLTNVVPEPRPLGLAYLPGHAVRLSLRRSRPAISFGHIVRHFRRQYPADGRP